MPAELFPPYLLSHLTTSSILRCQTTPMRSSSSPSSHSSLFPAALSIYQLARLNCRERLLVDPLQWTSRHVELLQCFFEKPSLAPSLASSTTQPDLINGRPVGCYVQALCSERHLKDLRISLIFEAPGGPFTTLLVFDNFSTLLFLFFRTL